jgi:hypothetical protein
MKVERLKVVDDGSIQLRDVDRYDSKTKECMSCYQALGKFHDPDCRHQLLDTWGKAVPRCDFRSISRDADRAFTRVDVILDRFDRAQYRWIIAGQGNLDRRNRDRNEHTLRVYLGRDATDFEHDSAYVLQLGLYGVHFEQTWYGVTTLTAFIPPDLPIDEFSVPKAGYNPFELEGTEMCEPDPGYHGRDHEPHPIVPEENYLPNGDPEQLKLLRGKRVRVSFGYVHPKDDGSRE